MRAPERLTAWRVVADPAALDALADAGTVLRLAADDALILGETGPAVGDPHAIVVPERGFVGWELTLGETAALAHRHIEWSLPPATALPAVAQGLIAQVPAKLWLRADGSALLLCTAAHAADLQERLEGLEAAA